MEQRSFDVVVLGGGCAGVAAACAAAGAGARVALVRAGPGLTAITAGAWHGPLAPPLASALAEAGLPYRRVEGPLPHPSGALWRAEAAAPLQAAVALLPGTLVCGIAGLPGFHAPALAALWGSAASFELESAVLEVVRTPAAGWAPSALATELTHDPGLVARPLATALRQSPVTAVLLPPVLGWHGISVATALSEAVGVPVGEALAAPPSLPGWRLDAALLAMLDRAGVTRFEGRATAAATAGAGNGGGMLTAAQVIGPAPVLLSAGAFVLATGKFTGGGLAAGPPLREAALGLPVLIPGRGAVAVPALAAVADPLAATAPERGALQPLLAASVATDEQGRPLGRDRPVFDNVFLAGSIRAQVDAASIGLGTAASDGWEAGLRAAAAGGRAGAATGGAPWRT
jgi:glycerol-3-phosphate dehydrogenase subunit B